jgi:hypothetical protein
MRSGRTKEKQIPDEKTPLLKKEASTGLAEVKLSVITPLVLAAFILYQMPVWWDMVLQAQR